MNGADWCKEEIIRIISETDDESVAMSVYSFILGILSVRKKEGEE